MELKLVEMGSAVEPEILLDLSRTMVPLGRTHVDDPNVISKDLANQVFKKACVLEVTTVGDDGVLKYWEGQCGLIRGDRLTPSPGQTVPEDIYATNQARFSVTPVTAKHNIESRAVEDHGFQHYYGAKTLLSLTGESGIISFPDGGWERTEEDALKLRLPDDSSSEEPAESLVGLYFTWGTIVDRSISFLTRKSTSFELVGSHFHLRGGEKIGIAVLWRTPVNLKQAGFPDNATGVDLTRYFHVQGTSNVHTGTIISVAEDESYFSHNINTYKGCSGAVVFLLDKDQPDHVRSTDHGKAIAIHGGADIDNDCNFAFTIYK